MPSLREPTANHGALGFCWIVYGVIRIVIAIWLIFFEPTATLMFGALLSRVADPFTLMAVFHFLYATTIVLLVLGGLIGIVAGLTIPRGQGRGRTLALVAAVLSLSDIPLGTTLGICTLCVLL